MIRYNKKIIAANKMRRLSERPVDIIKFYDKLFEREYVDKYYEGEEKKIYPGYLYDKIQKMAKYCDENYYIKYGGYDEEDMKELSEEDLKKISLWKEIIFYKKCCIMVNLFSEILKVIPKEYHKNINWMYIENKENNNDIAIGIVKLLKLNRMIVNKKLVGDARMIVRLNKLIWIGLKLCVTDDFEFIENTKEGLPSSRINME